LTAGLLASAAWLTPLAAQAADDANELEAIVVTAQKREQQLQDVPIAITALNSDALDKRGIKSVEDLQYSTPGLTMSQNNINNSRLILRGVGAENPVIGGDPGVSLNVDGHYLQSGAFLTRDFFDVERVEVLRGPQGTLYGRNAVGGAVNIITKKPTRAFEGSAALTYGSYDRILGQAAVSGPFTDRLRGRLAVSAESRDGYIENIVTGQDLNDSHYVSARGALQYDVSDKVQLNLSAFYSKDNSESGTLQQQTPYNWAAVIYALYPAAATTVNPSVANPRKVAFDDTVRKTDKTYGAFADLSWDLGFATFKSMTGWSKSEFEDKNQDLDFSPLHIATQDLPLNFRALTQEFQLTSNGDGPVSWVAGAFLYDETSGYTLFATYHYLALLIPNAQNLIFGPNDLKSKSYATYSQADWFVTDKVQLVAGLRYTYDKKTLVESSFAPALGILDPVTRGPKIDGPNTDHWDQLNYKVGVNVFPMEDVLVYGSLSTGYKAGGYQAGGSGGRSYDPETVTAWEAGLKSQWLDRRITLNVSAFWYDYKDKQEYRRPPVGVTFIENAAKATAKGVEGELVVLPARGLRLDGTLTYLDATYDEFVSVDETNPRQVGTPFACTPTPPATGCPVDVSGNRLTRSPEWKVSFGAEYTHDLGGLGSVSGRIGTVWVDKQFARPFNNAPYIIDAYWRSGARVSWTPQSGRYAVTAFVDNVENNDVYADAETNPSFSNFAPRGTVLPPRTFGVRVSADF
jgi:iron complex outermembrane receptor protein